ncbi:MAG: hypothetical protein MUC63_11045, partial [Planctomycetes bacterium]|nr:hypothetical protein [Planctomycetota bacterium]
REGTGLWPQMKCLSLEYDGRKEGGDLLLDDVRLLAPGEASASGAPPAVPAGPGATVMLGDFEDKLKSLAAWAARDSSAEISADEVRRGQWALRWSKARKGSSLELLRVPFSIAGCDRFSAWIRPARALSGGLVVAFGSDAERLAWCPVGPLPDSWSEVVLPLSRFSARGNPDRARVEHFVLLFEGEGEASFVLDDVRFLGAGGPAVPPPPGPGPRRGVVLDAEGNAVLAGPGAGATPEASESQAARSTEAWYTREGRPSIRWSGLGEASALVFAGVPESPAGFVRVVAWIYADSPTGTLRLCLDGDRGEIVADVDVDWIGWKRVDVPFERFRGGAPSSVGRWERLAFRFEGRPEDLREFYFDEIRVMKR